MLKKIIPAIALFASLLPAANASVYIGPGLTYASIEYDDSVYEGERPTLSLGVSNLWGRNYYLAGELNASPFTIQQNKRVENNLNLQTTNSFAISIIPGYQLDEEVLAYLRLGWANTNFTHAGHMIGGFITGFGMQYYFNQSMAVRGEWNYIRYDSLKGNYGHPSAGEYFLGLLYNLT